ncbi:hypothetical protein OG241_23725 [Streptomyces sp. NBC_01390]|uniref:hypothetical protein n=1 Tax=Streptomyces sp. NBC_01390 TaxID=2903850 RepID=UPI003254E9EF
MSVPRNADSWQQVSSRQDFAAYLRLLAIDCEHACNGQDLNEPVAHRWTNRTISDFLWGWVRILGERIDGTDLLQEEAPGRPGWQGLAFQLEKARTSPPGFNCALADSGTQSHEVDTAIDLRWYAATLATDFARHERERQEANRRGEWVGDGGNWAQSTLHDWLDAWAAWTDANSPHHTRLEPVTWRSVALQLAAAQIYE